MNTGILVFIEQQGGIINKTSWEALVAGQRLASALSQRLSAVMIGENLAAPASEVATQHVDEVIMVEDGRLAQYTPDGHTQVFKKLIEKRNPMLVLMSHTYLVRDFAPKLATSCGRALVSDCTGVRSEDGKLVFVRQIFQGKINADVTMNDDPPYFATFQAGAFRADQLQPVTSRSEVKSLPIDLSDLNIRSKPGEMFREAKQAVDLSQAKIIVAVGRGIKKQENLAVVEKLVGALGADLGASRPICDSGWLPMDRQIGSSGQTVAPKLYIAIGISGAIQHVVGMKGSSTIVAINKDKEAPIFEIADYGIVGDLFEVVPALTEALASS